MTSASDAMKTNELQRRRKLRLQQVREQSKDIAKVIRQRAKVENTRRIEELDLQKAKEYFDHQDKLIKHLENLYERGVRSVGAGHNNAKQISEENNQKQDLSQVRGKEAVTILRKKRQELLDAHKKLLDRKAKAREVANDISREKSLASIKQLAKTDNENSNTNDILKIIANDDKATTATDQPETNVKDQPEASSKTNMATQWESEGAVGEWEANVPELDLPPNENDTNKEVTSNRSKKTDLFALSKEMPPSLLGGLANMPEQKQSQLVKPSLTLVSEYIQNRDLRLRQPVAGPSKRNPDLHSIKQTIMRSRAMRTEAKSSTKKSPKPDTDGTLSKKYSVTMYNHVTKDCRNLPSTEKFVVRDLQSNVDAYSLAMKESKTTAMDVEQNKKVQDARNKIAISKELVEKEYKDTMAFLSSLPKDKDRPIKKAYKDERTVKIQKDKRQHKMQGEFKKIEKQCKRLSYPSSKPVIVSNKDRESKSPLPEDIMEPRDFQYSWMPVPESDSNLAIHTIPTSVKPKTGNNVKFSEVDSYHEYRSRHKHTPPTKETSKHKKVETVIIEKAQTDSSESSSASDTSSVENLRVTPEPDQNYTQEESANISGAERIVIYKVLDTKSEKKKKARKRSKLVDSVVKCLQEQEKKKSEVDLGLDTEGTSGSKDKGGGDRISIERLNEGVYQATQNNEQNARNLSGQEEEVINKCKYCNSRLTGRDARSRSHSPKEPGHHSSDCRRRVSPTRSGVSGASFHTARSQEGYVELLDEHGRQKGNLFLGTTGFLKDIYEVVVQLRQKNHDEAEVAQSCSREAVDPKEGRIDEPKAALTDAGTSVAPAPQPVRPASPALPMEQKTVVDSATSPRPPPEPVDSSAGGGLITVNAVTEAGQAAVPGAGECATAQTQTSPRGSPPRACMSSSTSTAYFSPPDPLLPRCLYQSPTYDQEEIVHVGESRPEPAGTLSPSPCERGTPPRSISQSMQPESAVPAGPARPRHGKCSRCSKRAHVKQCTRKHLVRDGPASRPPPRATRRPCRPPADLNPVIRAYVDQLVALNEQGRAAVRVLQQECSPVATPAASVLDTSTNRRPSAPDLAPAISLQDIESTLRAQILESLIQSAVSAPRPQRRKSAHKVKSLNISKKMNADKTAGSKSRLRSPRSSGSRVGERARSRSSPTPRPALPPPAPAPSRSSTRAPPATPAPAAPATTATQTHHTIHDELHYIKIAEDKLHNMEKIADLTEKCTNRLSNLAKVLEKVRRNKLAYSRASSSDASDCDQRSESDPPRSYDPVVEIYRKSPPQTAEMEVDKLVPCSDPPVKTIPSSEENAQMVHSKDGSPFSVDFPEIKLMSPPVPPRPLADDVSLRPAAPPRRPAPRRAPPPTARPRKPPPALARAHTHDDSQVPHELSTVAEVDSPMSLKVPTKSSANNTADDISERSTHGEGKGDSQVEVAPGPPRLDPDLLPINLNVHSKMSETKLGDDSKMPMLDLEQFNDIMLKPFISVQEYARQRQALAREAGGAEELSSLHSDASLPDVIAELLKRNIIAEPFKFEPTRVISSTSESTLSGIALPKAKRRSLYKNKENISESSDALSVSSNPDLEKAFKNMGMGWASSTLKKTKERLALSSSSNTSTSSLAQFKIKNFSQDIPPLLVSDTVSSAGHVSKPDRGKHKPDVSKHVEQQTSFPTPMTVKEFLANELSKKITFSEKTRRNETEDFVSLYETRLPEQSRAERSADSGAARARTSTPVQLYRSVTYHSSSSSNVSNGLFSNADDLSSVKVTSASLRNHSTSDKDDLTIPNCCLSLRKGPSDNSKSE